jgi:hypothetical protein
MEFDLIRRCPSCDTENPAQMMRCRCGALLVGLDLELPAAARAVFALAVDVPDASTPAAAPPSALVLCQFDDCAQPNPPGSLTCLYCNRALPGGRADVGADSSAAAPSATPDTDALSPHPTLLNLPATLASRYRILHPLASQGAQAELLLVEPLAGDAPQVVKIYRQGMQPKAAILDQLALVDPQYRVNLIEAGHADGYFYELMTYYPLGSWRTQMQAGALHEGSLTELVRALAPALAAIHAASLIHRDLKPDNILLASLEPLHLVLTDFGSASRLDATQRLTGNARTLPYAAPESLSGVIDAKYDYWGFGMIVLECALGSHPFADLSEAVIMHHLSTRSIDLSGVPMPALRKLLRGLLLRDPKLRWGASEVARWLANDPTLAEPIDSGSSHFKQPYHLGKEVCDTPAQLAIALARNWKLGLADSENGLLLAWFRDVQKDQNTERLLLELRFDSQMQVDVRLLKLILHLAPGIVPIWRGESLNLRTVLGYAARALKGEQAALDWLDLLWRQNVLKLYGEATDANATAEVANMRTRWSRAYDQFIAAWQQWLPRLTAPKDVSDFADFDDMLYGGHELERPSLSSMHARLLAIGWDAAWVARLRQRLQAEYAALAIDCPWLPAPTELAGVDAASLLVLEALLPHARKAQQRLHATRERRNATRHNELLELQRDLARCLDNLHDLANQRWLNPDLCAQMRQQLDTWFEIGATLRAAGQPDAAWQQLEREWQANRQHATALRQSIDELTQRHSVNSGWLNRYTLAFALLSLPFAASRGPRLLQLALLVLAGVLAWRLLPMPWMMAEIRTLVWRMRAGRE